jgi:hypothetical protein
MADQLPPLRIGQALAQGWRGLRRCPGPLLGFSAAACGLHLLGWGLFAAGHQLEPGPLALLLDGAGILLYGLSLLWLIQGLTRGGLALAEGRQLRWRSLARWQGAEAARLLGALLSAAGGLALAALLGFVAWSLGVFLLPALSLIPALLALLLLAAVALSQLFLGCLVIGAGLRPSRAVRRGLELLGPLWPSLLALAAMAGLILLLPFGLGLLAEAAVAGWGAAATALALVLVLPLLSNLVCAAYGQLPEAGIRPGARRSGAAGGTGWPDSSG